MTLTADVFLELLAPKNVVRIDLKKCVSQDASTDNIANGSKHCCNLNDSTFTIFINHCGRSCIGKNLF